MKYFVDHQTDFKIPTNTSLLNDQYQKLIKRASINTSSKDVIIYLYFIQYSRNY